MNLQRKILLSLAREQAQAHHHKYIRTEHLLLALLSMVDTATHRVWGLNLSQLTQALESLPCPTCAAEEKLELSAGASRALEMAESLSDDGKLYPNFVLIGIIQMSPTVRNLMASCDINCMRLLHQLENETKHA